MNWQELINNKLLDINEIGVAAPDLSGDTIMKIKVLGTGCRKCSKLYSEAEKAIAASGVKAELEKVERIEEIIQYGVMATPGLVIDGEVKSSGRIPQISEIIGWLKAKSG